MEKKFDILLVALVIILLAANVFFAYNLFSSKTAISKYSKANLVNSKIIAFDKIFVEKVLKTQGEVSYEERLQLQAAAMGTEDKDIINQWNQFLNSTTELDAQQNVLKLLQLFADKIIY